MLYCHSSGFKFHRSAELSARRDSFPVNYLRYYEELLSLAGAYEYKPPRRADSLQLAIVLDPLLRQYNWERLDDSQYILFSVYHRRQRNILRVMASIKCRSLRKDNRESVSPGSLKIAAEMRRTASCSSITLSNTETKQEACGDLFTLNICPWSKLCTEPNTKAFSRQKDILYC